MKNWISLSVILNLVLGYFLYTKKDLDPQIVQTAAFKIALENRRDFLKCQDELLLEKETHKNRIDSMVDYFKVRCGDK